jgi:RNA polymerase sigma-70 factor, ECF subfamily
MKANEDRELMLSFKQGNPCAFDALFDRYRDPVFSFLCRMLSGRADRAEDLLLEVFAKLAGARDRYEPTAPFASWIFALARNHCLNYLKSQARQQDLRTVSLDAQVPGAETTFGETIAAPAGRSAAQRETGALVERAIATLPVEYREVFILHAVEGFAHETVAQMTDLNPATVRTRYHRARQMLRAALGDVLGVPDPQPQEARP